MSSLNSLIDRAARSRERYENLRNRLHRYVIGLPLPSDSKNVEKLHTLPPLARNAAVLNDRTLRAAALRAGATACRVHPDVLARALVNAIKEAAPAEAAVLFAEEHTAAVHAAAAKLTYEAA